MLRTHEDDAGLILVRMRDDGLHHLRRIAMPLALQHAGAHVDEVGTRLLRQRLPNARLHTLYRSHALQVTVPNTSARIGMRIH